jgi:hypothetical protein
LTENLDQAIAQIQDGRRTLTWDLLCERFERGDKYRTTEEFVRTILGRTDFQMAKQETMNSTGDDEGLNAYKAQVDRATALQRMLTATVLNIEHVLDIPPGSLFGNA